MEWDRGWDLLVGFLPACLRDSCAFSCRREVGAVMVMTMTEINGWLQVLVDRSYVLFSYKDRRHSRSC